MDPGAGVLILLLAADVTVRLLGEGYHPDASGIAAICGITLRLSLVLLSLPLLFRRRSRFVMTFLFAWMLMITAAETIAYCRFDMTVRGEVFAIIMGSSDGEVASFLRDFLDWKTAAAILSALVALFFGCRWFWRRPFAYPRCPVTSFGAGLAMVFLSVLCGSSPHDALFVDFPVDSVRQAGRYRNLVRMVRKPFLSDVESVAPPVPVVMIVIGESATRDHWQLYGYSRETTPALQLLKDELVVFTDVLAAWSHTQEALLMLMSEATLADPGKGRATMPQVLSRAGYRCVLVSAQGHWGVFDSVDSLLFTGCDKRIYMDELSPPVEGWDERLLPFVERELASDDRRPLALFVHLYGSHCSYLDRFPASNAVFSAGKDVHRDGVDAYDDSIRYTDGILAGLIGLLSRDGREALMFHCSDHGESPATESVRVLSESSLWRIPVFFWCSPSYRDSHSGRMARLDAVRDLPLQADRLYDGLLELMNVRIAGRENESFLSEDFDRTVPRRIENGRRTCP